MFFNPLSPFSPLNPFSPVNIAKDVGHLGIAVAGLILNELVGSEPRNDGAEPAPTPPDYSSTSRLPPPNRSTSHLTPDASNTSSNQPEQANRSLATNEKDLEEYAKLLR